MRASALRHRVDMNIQLVSSLLFALGCSARAQPIIVDHPAHPDAAQGRLAGAPPALRPSVANDKTPDPKPPAEKAPADKAPAEKAPPKPPAKEPAKPPAKPAPKDPHEGHGDHHGHGA